MKLNTATEILFKEYAGYVEMMHSVGCSEKVRDWILHKMRHTYAVLHSVQTIISNDPVLVRLSREDKEVIESAALLHDIGRFSQHDGENILSNAEHPHGDVGYRMLSERGVTHPAVLLGVKTHDKFWIEEIFRTNEWINASQDTQVLIMHAVRAVRDADKLQNIQYVLFDGAELFSRFSESGEEKIRSEHLNSFMCGEMVEGAPRNKLESVLRVWGWKHDINYEWTERLLHSSSGGSFDRTMLGIFLPMARGVDDESAKRMEEHIYRNF